MDYLLTNAQIIDGSRAKPRPGRIGIRAGRLHLDPPEEAFLNARRMDLKGLCVAPGFIDIHTHSDACALAELSPQASMPLQGVTANLCANCGISLFPLAREHARETMDFYHQTVEVAPSRAHGSMPAFRDYAAVMERAPKRIHYGSLVGHGSLRACVLGFAQRKATKAELDQLCTLLDEQLSQGAFGLSLGLIYPPSSYGDLEEFAALGRVLKAREAILTVHMRSESGRIFEAVEEMIAVALASGVHLHISHLKLIGRPQWGRAKELLQLIEDARQQGATITCDQYPYEASSTGLTALVPGWAQDGGTQALLGRLRAGAPRLLNDIAAEMDRRGGPHCVEIASTFGHLPAIEGRRLDDIAREMGMEPPQAVAAILIACQAAVVCIYYSIDWQDILTIMRDLRIAVGSDGYNLGFELDYKPHPRSFGSFPRFLRTVREQRLMPLEDAVYKMSGLPAEILRLRDRGFLREGYRADLTVFDPAEVVDGASFQQPALPPRGIPYVFVEGELVVDREQLTDAFPGRMLYRGA